MTTSIPWCSGAERNLGRCFGNQGGGRSADGKTEGRVERKHGSEQLGDAKEILLPNTQTLTAHRPSEFACLVIRYIMWFSEG